VQALAKTTSQHAARFDEGTVTRIMNPASPQADARRTPTLEQIGQEVGEEAEAIYTMIDKKLGDERINITDASQIDVHDQFQAVLAQQQHSFTHLRSFNVPQDLFALSNGHQRQNFIAKMIQFAGDKYGYGKISLEKAKELYLGKK
jgi:hypothetical protein